MQQRKFCESLSQSVSPANKVDQIKRTKSSIHPPPHPPWKKTKPKQCFFMGYYIGMTITVCLYVSICQWFNNCLDDIFCTTQTCYGEASSWARVSSLARSHQGLKNSLNVCQSYIFCTTDLFVTKECLLHLDDILWSIEPIPKPSAAMHQQCLEYHLKSLVGHFKVKMNALIIRFWLLLQSPLNSWCFCNRRWFYGTDHHCLVRRLGGCVQGQC